MDINATDRFWHFSFAESCVLPGHNVHLSAKEVQSVNYRLDSNESLACRSQREQKKEHTAALLQLESNKGRDRRRR